MSVVINSNFAATVASNNLASSNDSLQKSLNRLSSGSKIVSPADDAGGLAVSMKLSAAARRQGAVNNNLGNAISFLQTQDGALKITGKILDRMSELPTMYDDVTKSTSDKGNYGTEFTALQSQLTAIAGEAFNGVNLFTTSDLPVYTSEQGAAGTASGAQVLITGRDLGGTSAGVGSLTSTSTTLGTVSLSSITDVDVAQESTQLARFNILVQSGTAMLSQANQSAQIALKLLQ